MNNELKLWYDGSDTVIAFSPADASVVWAEHIGEAHSDARHPWREWTEVLTADVEDGSDGAVTWTPAEWIATKGRGFLCSEDR